MASAHHDVAAPTERYRGLRRALESEVPPLATSLDGRSFRLQAPVGLSLRPGGYVALETGDGPVLGQVIDYDLRLEEGPEISGSAGPTPFTSRLC